MAPEARLVLLALCVSTGLAYDNTADLPFENSWITESQSNVFAEKPNNLRGKYLLSLYEGLSVEQKNQVHHDILPKCYSNFLTESQREELEQLHHSGDHVRCHDRVKAIKKELTKQQQDDVESYWELCEHVWYHTSHDGEEHHDHHAHHHHKRHLVRGERIARSGAHHHSNNHKGHHGEHGLEDYLQSYLHWLNDAQKETLREMKRGARSEDEIRARVLEFFDKAEGEQRSAAEKSLQDGCITVVKHIIPEGEDIEYSQSNAELYNNIKEKLNAIKDEAKLARAKKYDVICRKAFGVAERKRRNKGNYELEHKLTGPWDWLSEDQKTFVRGLKNEGKNDDFILNQVFTYFKELHGKEKEKAEDGLQSSCSGPILSVLGPVKAAELKKFMESGNTPAAYEAKVKELLKDGTPSKKLSKTEENCKFVFQQAVSRRRRHEGGHHSLEDYLKTHLSWLTDAQKEEVRQLKTNGKSRDEIQQKVLEFYKSAEGPTKEKATAELQSGCKEILVDVIGKEKAEELKKLREGGASLADVVKKAEELVNAAGGDNAEKIKSLSTHCKTLFGVARRRRHDHGKHTLEDYLKSHLSWLNDDQKAEVRKLKKEGKGREEIQKKVFEYYGAATGDQKEKATADLQSGCKELLEHVIGKDKVTELSTLHQSGSSLGDIAKKADEFINAVPDNQHVQEAKKYSQQCKGLFGLA